MSFQIKPASRKGVNPLICLYSESGCGKTYSALLLARGIAGPKGRIVVGDTENGRASLYADVLSGGYDTIDIDSPFSPARMIEAMDVIEASGAAVGILDSGSHEWEGDGGVLSMAADLEATQGKNLGIWRKPKMEHAKFILRLTRSKIPWIVCLRAKYKTRQTKVNGRTEIIKDDTTSPIQAEDFIFEATCHAELLPNHSIILTKHSHPSLKPCFPEDKTTPLTIEHGKMIAAWCASGGSGSPAVSQTVQASGDELAGLKKRLGKLLRGVVEPLDKEHMAAWLVDNLCMDPAADLSELTTKELSSVIALVEERIKTV